MVCSMTIVLDYQSGLWSTSYLVLLPQLRVSKKNTNIFQVACRIIGISKGTFNLF